MENTVKTPEPEIVNQESGLILSTENGDNTLYIVRSFADIKAEVKKEMKLLISTKEKPHSIEKRLKPLLYDNGAKVVMDVITSVNLSAGTIGTRLLEQIQTKFLSYIGGNITVKCDKNNTVKVMIEHYYLA